MMDQQALYDHNRSVWHYIPSTVPGIGAWQPFMFDLTAYVQAGGDFGGAAKIAALLLSKSLQS
jgi:hypothetical protein